MLIIDSNIWAYYFDRDAPEHEKVIKPVENALDSEEIILNTIIIMEIAHFLIKNLGPITGKTKLTRFLNYPFKIIDLDHNLLLTSVDVLIKYSHTGIGGRDATIIATAQKLGLSKIMTHDTAFTRIKELEVIDPIST